MTNPQRNTRVTTEAVGDGLGVFDPAINKSYMLNATSALVFQHADGQTSPQQLMERLRQKFNVPADQAEQLLWLSLDELQKANLLQGTFTTTQAPRPMLSRRQALRTFAAAGLSMALMPLVAPVAAHAQGSAVKPVLECVSDNGDGTYTARFGYLNQNAAVVTIAVGGDNKFTPSPQDRGQTTEFQPGRQRDVFRVTFDGSNLVWTLKGPDGRRRTSTASSNPQQRCAPEPTTTPTPATTTTPAPTTTVVPTTTEN